MALQTILSKFSEIIAPYNCLICGEEGEILCVFCVSESVKPKVGSCIICNRLSPGGRTCTSCRHKTVLYEVPVASRYEGVVKELIHKLKYESGVSVAAVLAGMITSKLEAKNYDFVTCVPATAKHRRLRGYNHAELIARAVASKLGLLYAPLLVRTGSLQQVGKTRAERKAQVGGAFEVKNARLIAGKRVLVIDDVLTTGATLNECAQVLKTAGAKRVSGAVVARD